MTRINVPLPDGGIGWFDLDASEEFAEATAWDGDNHVSVCSGDRYAHQRLYRTAGGRWVLHGWSQWVSVPDTYEFVDPERAKDWLLLNSRDDAVAELFGEIEPERGPGRPEIGGRVSLTLSDERVARIDAWAEEHGYRSRGAAVRDLLDKALD